MQATAEGNRQRSRASADSPHSRSGHWERVDRGGQGGRKGGGKAGGNRDRKGGGKSRDASWDANPDRQSEQWGDIRDLSPDRRGRSGGKGGGGNGGGGGKGGGGKGGGGKGGKGGGGKAYRRDYDVIRPGEASSSVGPRTGQPRASADSPNRASADDGVFPDNAGAGAVVPTAQDCVVNMAACE